MGKKEEQTTKGAAVGAPASPASDQDAAAQRAAEETRLKAEEEAARAQAEDAARRQAEEEAARLREEAAARLQAEETARQRAAQSRPLRVEVLVSNLGPNLLKKGTVTSDPQVVALLNRPSGTKLVREVKE